MTSTAGQTRESLLALQPVLDRLSSQVCVFDRAMTVLAANEAFCAFADSVVADALRGDGGEARAGAAWGILQMAAGESAESACALRAGVEAVARGEQASYEHAYTTHIAGRLRCFALRAQPCELQGERAVLIEQTETTRQKLLERRLLRAERAEGAELLASSVAHDINNLLLVIGGYAELLSSAAGPDDTSAADRAEISRAIKNASQLTQQLLALRPNAVRNSTVGVNKLITELSRTFAKLAGEDVNIELELDERVGRVEGEAALVQQVLSNLVRNAAAAMPNGGRLRLSTHSLVVQNVPDAPSPAEIPPGHWVVMRVQDTGVGMDARTRQRAFEPFFTTKTEDEAAGLGLWVVQELVRRAHGHVRLTSQKGEGTTVEVYLPGLAPGAAQLFGGSRAPAGPRATLLVVEDNKAVRDLLQRVLRGAGYHVLVASGPSEARAISECENQPIHLLLTDVVMSDMSGPLLAAELQRQRPELAVVLMSGYTGTTCAQREQWSPSATFLEKPFTASHVLRTVQDALAAAPLRASAPAASVRTRPEPGTPEH